MTHGIERTFPRPFLETFRISKNEDFNGPYLENENEFLKNSFETVFRASKSCDRGQLVLAFQLTFKEHVFIISDDLGHDNYSVHHVRTLIHNYLLDTVKCNVKKLHEFADGCSAQYKSRHCMGSNVLMSRCDFGYPTQGKYFETHHMLKESKMLQELM